MTPKTTTNLPQTMDDQGYVVLRGFLETAVVDEVRRELASIVDEIARGLVAMDLAADPLEDEPFETRLAQLFKGYEELAPMILRHNLQRQGFYRLCLSPEVPRHRRIISRP